MPQTTIQSGGQHTIPKSHYVENRPVYDYIEERLRQTRSVFESADNAGELLRHSTEYAIISVQTKVSNHEPAFLETRGVSDQSEIADIFADNTVMYHNNKARYIAENRDSVDFNSLASRLKDGEIDAVHESIVDQCLGLGSAKGAFSLSMLGYTEKLCVDSHTANIAGLERDASADANTEEYEQLSQTILDTFSSLADELEPFMVQWIMFSADKGSLELHDPYYMWVEHVTGKKIT
jgi:thermostable 8-oxoguanine DNA glycosylase